MIDISVIIPIYKGKKYLKFLIDILNINIKSYEMKYGKSCEAIIVNDYPSERLEIPNTEQYIHIYNLEKNRGIHGARVFGYSKAKGNYIVFLDQDDKISEDYLISQKESIGKADAVVCNGYRERFCIRGKRAIYTLNNQMDKIEKLSDYIFEKNWIRSPGQVLLKKVAIPELWLKEIIKNNGADDYFLWILMTKMNCVFNINRKHLYTHVEYGENTSNKIETMKKSIGEMVSILYENKVLSIDEFRELQKKCDLHDSEDKMKHVIVYDYWVYLHIRNKKLEDYFRGHNYKTIAIYGMGYIGNRIFDELHGSSVKVMFAIDKAAEGIEFDIPILNMENISLLNMIGKVDVIVVTAINQYQNILHNFQKICNKPVVSIEDILLEMISQIH